MEAPNGEGALSVYTLFRPMYIYIYLNSQSTQRETEKGGEIEEKEETHGKDE